MKHTKEKWINKQYNYKNDRKKLGQLKILWKVKKIWITKRKVTQIIKAVWQRKSKTQDVVLGQKIEPVLKLISVVLRSEVTTEIKR